MDTTANGISQTSRSVIAVQCQALQPEHRNMITNNFLRSLPRECFLYGLINKKEYFDWYHPVVNNLIDRTNSVARFSVLTDDPDVILGWSLCSGDTLHYVLVKGTYRNQGICKSLIPQGIKWCTHLTKPWISIIKKYPEMDFSPRR